MIIAGSGHRPEKCASEHLVRERVSLALRQMNASHFICGMAAGFDLWAGSTALRMGIPVTAAKPWNTHGPRVQDKQLYLEVLESAVDVVNVVEADEYPGPWAYQRRNEWMVDHAEAVLAYWDGTRGGTFNCLTYAKKIGRPVNNIHAKAKVL
jgi:uncharacterized phage-like protein YoqJ